MLKNIINSLNSPKPLSHKGENGRLMIIGGSRMYHGAAQLTILAARRFVDLIYFYPGEPAVLPAIRCIPEVIVERDLSRLPEMDAVLFGNGIAGARLPFNMIARHAKRLIIDADGFRYLHGGNRIPAHAILTPHEGEFRGLFGCHGSKSAVEKHARSNRCIILKKDPAGDIISDGKRTVINNSGNAGMTKGGTGDVLAGLTAALACKNDSFAAAAAAAYINGYAADMLQKEYGFYFCASDLADMLAKAYFKIRTR